MNALFRLETSIWPTCAARDVSVFQEEFITVQMLHVTRMLSVELIVVNVDASALQDSQAMDMYAHQVKTYIYIYIYIYVLNIDIYYLQMVH